MANGHGGVRANSGRKTKAETLDLPGMLNEVMGEDGRQKILQILRQKAEAGSFQHLQLLLSYDYGKPVDHKEINLNSNVQVQWGDEEETT